MRKLCVVVSNSNANNNVYETIDSIKNAGFNNVFIQWYNKDTVPTQEEQLNYIKSKNINILFAHLGYKNINDIWTDKGDYLVDYYKRDIKILKENNIDLVIMHLTNKLDAPKYNELGLNRLRQICDYAKELNVDVAFENTKIPGYLEYVIDNISNDNVGICFDSGHYHAHFKDKFDFDKFKNKILAIHLHDNNGIEDEHLIPFDGNINWNELIDNLDKCNYSGPITLELCYRNEYLNMNINDFYKKGYDTSIKLLKMTRK